jgi:hypothetical protein
MTSNTFTSVERHTISAFLGFLSLLIFALGILAANGYASHPTNSPATHLGFASVFFFLGMFIRPNTKLGLTSWFDKFRRIYYYVCTAFFFGCLGFAGYFFILG